MEYLFLISGLCLVVIFNIRRKPNVDLNTVIIKGSASLCFIFTGLFAFIGNRQCPPYMGALTVTGACFGLIGDIVLDLKYVYKDDADKYLKTGFMSFLIGHIFYMASMIYAYGAKPYVLIFTAICFVCGILFALGAEKILKLNYGKFRLITVLYTSVLNSTVGLAVGFLVAEPGLHTVVFTVGMFLFLISDAILSRTYFSPVEKDRKSRLAIVLNHSTYFAAQYLIAVSLMFFRG
ncbi:MAG: lysoplasmalogenase [Clostridia bacterium]|nr:lysoplasmalogenase [Clostridia bacterium]